jgi:hypothetical protein
MADESNSDCEMLIDEYFDEQCTTRFNFTFDYSSYDSIFPCTCGVIAVPKTGHISGQQSCIVEDCK